MGFCEDGVDSLNTTRPSNGGLSTDSMFQKSEWELGINSGVMLSPSILNVQKHTVNYTVSGIQAGYMLDNPGASGWYRGNFELAGELFGGAVIQGRGSYVGGGTVWLRYNLLASGWRLKPYVQIGGGAESTDIDRRILGENFNFNLDAGLGFRYLITSRCSVNLEYRFQHFSDADLSAVNLGVNAQGAFVGVSFFF
jgi:opacity protein-like surface antigen